MNSETIFKEYIAQSEFSGLYNSHSDGHQDNHHDNESDGVFHTYNHSD